MLEQIYTYFNQFVLNSKQKYDTSNDGYLSFTEVINFFNEITERSEISDVFNEITSNKDQMSPQVNLLSLFIAVFKNIIIFYYCFLIITGIAQIFIRSTRRKRNFGTNKRHNKKF